MADVIDNKAKQPSSGTGFTNLQRVLNANQNNRLGGTINSGVSNVIGQANTNLNQSKQQFNEQAQKGSVGSEQDKQYVATTLQDPTKAQQSDFDKFNRFRAGYQGPQGIQNEQLKGQQQEINSLGGLTSTSGGKQALLQRFVGSPQYNQGQQKLDTLLLGQGNGSNLNQLRRQTQEANKNINQGFDTAANQANLLKAKSAGFGQDVTNQLTGAKTGLETDLANRATQYTEEEQALHDVLSNLFTPVKNINTPSNGNAVGIGLANQQTGPNPIEKAQYDKALAALARSGQSGQDLLNQAFYGASAVEGFDPNAVIGNINPYTKEQVATDQDILKAQNLAKLAGDNGPTGLYAPGAVKGSYDPLSFLDQSNLGKYETLGKQNYDKAQQAIKNAQEYQNDVNRVKEIQKQQSALLAQAKQQNPFGSYGGFTSGGTAGVGFTPEQQAKFDALQNERSNLAQKQALMSHMNVLANYAPVQGYEDPYAQSVFDQAIAQATGNAQRDINTWNPVTQTYAGTTIGERLKALLNNQGQS